MSELTREAVEEMLAREQAALAEGILFHPFQAELYASWLAQREEIERLKDDLADENTEAVSAIATSAQQRALVEQLLAQLRAGEWIEYDEPDYYCRACGAWKADGHKPACPIGQAIRAAEAAGYGAAVEAKQP